MSKPKPRPPATLFALGYKNLPGEITTQNQTYRFVKLFKHDFFAATGLYENISTTGNGAGGGGLAVLKIQRTEPYLGLPMAWLGRFVARREIRIYQKLQGIRGIPAFLGTYQSTGFLHEFIPGVDLHRKLPLTPAFFTDLENLFKSIHERHIAYVDSNKRENILYGDDGRPWLIDFQISFDGEQSNFFMRSMLRRFIRADWYHFYKHKTHLLRSACTPEDFERAQKRGFLHQLHRFFARPLILIRRKMLSRYNLENTR